MSDTSRLRRYGIMGRTAEDTSNCIQTVLRAPSFIPHQCGNKRGYGPNGEYCKKHGEKEQQRQERMWRVNETD